MNTIESILSQLTSNALAADVKAVLREQDPEFPPVETAFKEATCALRPESAKRKSKSCLQPKSSKSFPIWSMLLTSAFR